WSFAALATGARHVTGIEARPHVIDSARQSFAAYGVAEDRFRFVQGDCLDMLRMIPPGQVDTVFCFGFLHHTLSPFELLREIRRIDPEHLIIDSRLLEGDAAAILLGFDDPSLDGAAVATAGGQARALVGIPTRRALDLMLLHLGYDVGYFDWAALVRGDAEGVEDYQQRRRFSLVARRPPGRAEGAQPPSPAAVTAV